MIPDRAYRLFDGAPFLVQWLLWCVDQYLALLPLCAGWVLLLRWWQERSYIVRPPMFEWETLPLTLFGGFCLWVVVCLFKQGHGLG